MVEASSPLAIAVFGGSEPTEDSPLYQQALQVGGLLAREGFTVVTGGYGGVMEAASRGAKEAGGSVVGITARALSPLRAGPNPYLTIHLEEEGLFERTRELIARSSGYIILRGSSGTLAELTFLWALHRARLQRDRPIVLLGAFWQRFVDTVVALGLVDSGQLTGTHVVNSPEDAVRVIRRALQ